MCSKFLVYTSHAYFTYSAKEIQKYYQHAYVRSLRGKMLQKAKFLNSSVANIMFQKFFLGDITLYV